MFGCYQFRTPKAPGFYPLSLNLDRCQDLGVSDGTTPRKRGGRPAASRRNSSAASHDPPFPPQPASGFENNHKVHILGAWTIRPGAQPERDRLAIQASHF